MTVSMILRIVRIDRIDRMLILCVTIQQKNYTISIPGNLCGR